jgi:hypothetical protein
MAHAAYHLLSELADALDVPKSRLIAALDAAADACEERGLGILAELPKIDEDYAPDAPYARTRDGCTYADADEWAEDAAILQEIVMRAKGRES